MTHGSFCAQSVRPHVAIIHGQAHTRYLCARSTGGMGWHQQHGHGKCDFHTPVSLGREKTVVPMAGHQPCVTRMPHAQGLASPGLCPTEQPASGREPLQPQGAGPCGCSPSFALHLSGPQMLIHVLSPQQPSASSCKDRRTGMSLKKK